MKIIDEIIIHTTEHFDEKISAFENQTYFFKSNINKSVIVSKKILTELLNYQFYLMSNLTKDTEPLVSIISTLYNASRFINDTFNSVFNQNYENWEQ